MQNLDAENLVGEHVAWSNKDNNIFYETVKAEGLQKLAERAGLTTGCDLSLLTPYWSKAHSILEVGAGYGRALDYLVKHQFQGKITAIERCNILAEYLKTNFKSYKNIFLLHDDIRHLNNNNDRFDLILFLWAGICDFSFKEQSLLIKKLATLLTKSGTLVIDTLSANYVPIGSKKYDERIYALEVNNSTVYLHLPTSYEIENYAKEAGLKNITCLNYKTNTNRERLIYTLNLI